MVAAKLGGLCCVADQNVLYFLNDLIYIDYRISAKQLCGSVVIVSMIYGDEQIKEKG